MNRGSIEDLFKQMTPVYDWVCKCTESQEKELLDAQERIDYQLELITSRVFIIYLLQHIQCIHRHCQSPHLQHIKDNVVDLIIGCYSTPIDKSPLIETLTRLVSQFEAKQENSDSSTNELKSKDGHEGSEKPLNVEAFTLRFKEATYELFRQDWDRRKVFAAAVQNAVIKEIEKGAMNAPAVSGKIEDSITDKPSFTPSFIVNNQRQYLIQELDLAINSLEREIDGGRETMDKPEQGLHELIHQVEDTKKEMDASLHEAIAGDLASPLDEVLQDLSFPARKPVTAQADLHPTIVSAQETLSRLCNSVRQEHDKFVEEKDVLLKETPIQLFINTLLRTLPQSSLFADNGVDSKTLVTVDELIAACDKIITDASPIAENLKQSHMLGDPETRAQYNADFLAEAAEKAFNFLEAKKEIPPAPSMHRSGSLQLTTPLKTVATMVREFFDYSESKQQDLKTLITHLLPLSGFVTSLLPPSLSERLSLLSLCSPDIQGVLKLAMDSMDRLSTTVLPPLSPLLQISTSDEVIGKPSVSRPVTSTVLRSFSKKYAATNQLLKQLLTQLEKSKKKLLDQCIKKEEADELRREQENYSNLETETQLDKLIDNLKTTYICPTCRDELSNAFLVGCGHIACAACLYHMYETRTRKCPICQKPYKQEDIVEFAVIR
ncbi:E3 ubiquitin ligase for Rad6p required for the ubiquitination of histone H2B [Giardia duodenalis ATCC 50581]|uniref:E3 ubiquitin protein ligase n=1 Tax=Giardia intestinalis (strain ATCC 50581 / GS clone H7) TaxID=598745 RepID=C6LUD8_GIAIB|nr:E3 ubiquitin ligase for Rad6p required for the ubiquitination of histone H2B [Giardia intestinalis ATCC 50581]